MLSDDIRSAIVERIKEATVETDVSVNDETDLYGDLRIWGDDFYDVVAWIAETFGTDFSAMDASKFVPGEGLGEFGVARIFIGKSPYRRCTLGDLLAAVERGRWED